MWILFLHQFHRQTYRYAKLTIKDCTCAPVLMDAPHERILTVLTPQKLDKVAALFIENPQTSLQKGWQVVDISYSSIQRAIKKLKFITQQVPHNTQAPS